jgi:hypothetical protein
MLSISSVYSDFSSIFGEILTEYSPSILGRVLSTIFGSIFDPFFCHLFPTAANAIRTRLLISVAHLGLRF